MAFLPKEELAKYTHSPIHYAVACKDHAGLQKIIDGLPQLAQAGTIHTEEDAIAEEQRAETLSEEIDRRDVAGRETPLHLAVRMSDMIAAEILITSGADSGLQNEQGWSALQEAVCAREEAIASLMTKFYPPIAWARWCRRVPRVIGTMKRIMDFYMEVTFHFESSVIPFIGKIAPSDTYRIWKKGSSLRADMTIAGFDGFKVKRSDQSCVFHGDGSADGKIPPRSLCILKHKKKCILNALDGAGKQLTELEATREVAEMLKTNMYRPGLDVTRAILMPQLTWRRQERSETVGKWKCKVYDMHHVQLSMRSRRVPGALTDEELFASGEFNVKSMEPASKDFEGLLNEEEKKQLDKVLSMESTEVDDDDFYDARLNFDKVGVSAHCMDDTTRASSTCHVDLDSRNDKKGGLAWCKDADGAVRPRISLCNDEIVNNLLDDDCKTSTRLQMGRMSVDTQLTNFGVEDTNGNRKDRRNRVAPTDNGTKENEYTMGVRPVLWLAPNFPLKTEEMLPLLDILADKVKAVRRLREVLTTKLPAGTFPVKIAIPIVPTIRVIVTFTKFEQLRSDEAFTAGARGKESDHNGNSWFSWKRGPTIKTSGLRKDQSNEAFDPFAIPDDYVWISNDAKKFTDVEKTPKT